MLVARRRRSTIYHRALAQLVGRRRAKRLRRRAGYLALVAAYSLLRPALARLAVTAGVGAVISVLLLIR